MTACRFVSVMLFLVAGLLIWAAQFGLIYGFNALACARGFVDMTMVGIGIVPLVVTIATAIAVLAIAWVLMRGVQSNDSFSDSTRAFINYTATGVGVLAIIAVIWNWVPALIVPPCG